MLFYGCARLGPYIGWGHVEGSAEYAVKIREISKTSLECDFAYGPTALAGIGEHAVRQAKALAEHILGERGVGLTHWSAAALNRS